MSTRSSYDYLRVRPENVPFPVGPATYEFQDKQWKSNGDGPMLLEKDDTNDGYQITKYSLENRLRQCSKTTSNERDMINDKTRSCLNLSKNVFQNMMQKSESTYGQLPTTVTNSCKDEETCGIDEKSSETSASETQRKARLKIVLDRLKEKKLEVEKKIEDERREAYVDRVDKFKKIIENSRRMMWINSEVYRAQQMKVNQQHINAWNVRNTELVKKFTDGRKIFDDKIVIETEKYAQNFHDYLNAKAYLK